MDRPLGSLELTGISVGGIFIIVFGIGLVAVYRKFYIILSQRNTGLTTSEISEFREGNGGSTAGSDTQLQIEWLPYNSKFEIPRHRIFPGEKSFISVGDIKVFTILIN